MSIKVIVVDNSKDLLDKLTAILKGMEGVEVCGSFDDAITAMQHVKENKVDMVFSLNRLKCFAKDKQAMMVEPINAAT